MKSLSAVTASVLAVFLFSGMPDVTRAQDAPPDGAEVLDETGSPLETTPALNETQTARAERFAEASGVSQEEIIAMRLGTVWNPPDDPQPPIGGFEEVEAPVTEEDRPQGRGWGVIARWLGLHPSISGNARGRAVSETSEAEGAPDTGLLEARNRVRNNRLYGQCRNDALTDSEDSPRPGSLVSGQNQERRAERAQARSMSRSRARERSNNRGGNGNAGGNSNRGGNGNGRGNSNRGGNGNGRGRNN